MSELFRRKYLISFFYLIISIVGILVWKKIPLENTPELNLPSITVNYTWGSTAPEIVEKEITRKVESAATRLRNVTNIRSITSEGQSSVTITFSKETPVDFRTLELREYLFSLEEELPENISPARISRRVPEELEDQQTFIVYTLNGNRPPRELLGYARESIKPKLLGLEGLAGIDIQGVPDPALIIEFEAEKLEKYNLDPRQVMSEIRERLNWRSSGFFDQQNERYSFIIPPDFKNVSDIQNFDIELPGSLKIIKLYDIANVSIDEYPAKSIKRINGDPSLTIEFVKESGADAMGLARNIRSKMNEIHQQLPEGLNLLLTLDSTETLREQFDRLQLQALLSGLLVFLVVILFVRKIKAPVVIMGSVLFSVLLSLILLYGVGYTLNIITLAGITIALGMLIDNAVVVFEQLNPGLSEPKDKRLQHVIRELPGAVVPVLGSTFTTVGIFVPLLFALEELRIFLVPLAVALTLTLVSSVLIAFTWIPYSLIWVTPVSKRKSRARKKFFSKNRIALQILQWKSKLKWVFVAAVIATVGIPLFAIEEPDWEETAWPEFTQVYFENRDNIDPWIGGLSYRFFNETYFGSPWRRNDSEIISVYIRSPQGTPLSEIDKVVSNFEKIARPYAQAFEYYEARLSEYFGARMSFVVKPEYLTRPDPYYFFGEAMYLAARTGNVATSVSGFGDGISTGFGGSSVSHTIRLKGYSYNELLGLAKELERRLKESRRVREVDINASSYYSRDDFYQYILNLDSEKILSYGVDKRQVISSVMMDLYPENPFGKVEFQGQEMYLIGRNLSERRYEAEMLEKVRKVDTVSFSLASVGNITKEKALTEIRRENQSYQRNVQVNYLGNYRMGAEYIEEVIDHTSVPVGASVEFGSSFFSTNEEENTRNLFLIALLSILSVWMIVSALLESFKLPVFVILAVPYSFIGIMTGVLVNDLAFDRGAIAGSLLCIGVVVNNAILLYHQKKMEEGNGIHGLRSWMNVYRKRIRAILITTVTTISGLVPMMLFGGGSEFWENLAIVVIWGLSFSTVLLIFGSGLFYKKKGLTKKT